MGKKKYQRHILVAVKQIKEFLDKNPANGFSTESLAASVRISRRILHEAFKDEFGIKIGEYKLQSRMQQAQKMLLEGCLVKEVAFQLHYSSISAFSDAFKLFFGLSPSEWQNLLKDP